MPRRRLTLVGNTSQTNSRVSSQERRSSQEGAWMESRGVDGDFDTLFAVLELVRTGVALTRPDLGRISGLGRALVSERVERLQRVGLVEEVGLGRSTGGRQPRQLRFQADAGTVLVADVGT